MYVSFSWSHEWWHVEMLGNVVFVLTEVQEPYAVVVLLEKDFVVVDLTQSKWAIFSWAFLPLAYKHTSCPVRLCEWCNSMWCSSITLQTDTLSRGNSTQHPIYIVYERCVEKDLIYSVCVRACVRVNITGLVTHKHPSNELLLRDWARVSPTHTHWLFDTETFASLTLKVFFA